MQIQPAKLEYVQHAMDGKIAVVTAESSTVAEDLKKHDPCLQLWYLEDVMAGAPPVYTVWRIHINGRPSTAEEMQSHGLEPELVLSAMECDQRIVDRVRQIDGNRGDYDYIGEIDRMNRRAEQAKHDRVREATEEHAEELAWAIRRDLGTTYKHRPAVWRWGKDRNSVIR